MADAFDAFSHWPRRARHTAIWAVVLTAFAASAAIDEQPAVDERGIAWVRIDEIQASASTNDLVTTPTVPDHFRP